MACSSAPFTIPYMATPTLGFNFGNRQAAVIQRQNTSSAILLVNSPKDEDSWPAKKLKADPVHVNQTKSRDQSTHWRERPASPALHCEIHLFSQLVNTIPLHRSPDEVSSVRKGKKRDIKHKHNLAVNIVALFECFLFFFFLLVAAVTVAMHQQGRQSLARLCLWIIFFKKGHKKPASEAESSDRNGYTVASRSRRVPPHSKKKQMSTRRNGPHMRETQTHLLNSFQRHCINGCAR